MARFTDDNANYFTVSSWPISALPFSVSMWVRRTVASSTVRLLQVNHSTADHAFELSIGSVGNVTATTRNSPSGASSSSGGTTISTGQWYQIGGIWRAGNNYRNHWVNGGAGTAETTTRSVTISGQNAAFLQFATGDDIEIADATVWDSDIGTDGMLQHAKGFAGRLIRPESLVFYAPFVRGKTDHKAGQTVTEAGTVGVSAHPPIIGAIAA